MIYVRYHYSRHAANVCSLQSTDSKLLISSSYSSRTQRIIRTAVSEQTTHLEPSESARGVSFGPRVWRREVEASVRREVEITAHVEVRSGQVVRVGGSVAGC